MAPQQRRDNSNKSTSRNPSSFIFLPSLLFSVALIFAISLLGFHGGGKFQFSPYSFPHLTYQHQEEVLLRPCNYSDGDWVYDPTFIHPPYHHSCKEIFKGWNCIASNKSNALDIFKWRWKPRACPLPPFPPSSFLHRYRDSSIGFIGDSLNRNMFISLFCALKRASSEVKKWRPVGADRGYTFIEYNLTIAYHRTNLLARYRRWYGSGSGDSGLEALGFKEGFRVDVDIPESSWVASLTFHHVFIFNTGHWWKAPSKFDPKKSPLIFYEKGFPLMPPISPEKGLDIVLKNMISHVNRGVRPGSIKFFGTQSPRHFEGGDWDSGGSCTRLHPMSPAQAEQMFSPHNATNKEARDLNHHLHTALHTYPGFHILDITPMSELRPDAHPSASGGKRHHDCMHWCLPGVPDTWVHLLFAFLNHFDL